MPELNAVNQAGQKVAVITGGSQGIGAGLVAGYRRQGWSVVATARTIKPTEDPDAAASFSSGRSEEHTSELQSLV